MYAEETNFLLDFVFEGRNIIARILKIFPENRELMK